MGLFSRQEPEGRPARVSDAPRAKWEPWERSAARWVPDPEPGDDDGEDG